MAGRSKDWIPVGAIFSQHVQTGPGAHSNFSTMDTGSFSGVKRPQRGVDHTTASGLSWRPSSLVSKGAGSQLPSTRPVLPATTATHCPWLHGLRLYMICGLYNATATVDQHSCHHLTAYLSMTSDIVLPAFLNRVCASSCLKSRAS
jgi:hypothetical protein